MYSFLNDNASLFLRHYFLQLRLLVFELHHLGVLVFACEIVKPWIGIEFSETCPFMLIIG